MNSSRSKYRCTAMHWLLLAVLALGLGACASIGRPQGGAKDELPPVFVYSNPAPDARNVSKQRIDLYFNENVQLQDAFNKVIVSPVQTNNPAITANGKHVSVQLKDTLLPNTTYTIDFGDAIKDLNEGNLLDGFTTAFSTGDSIDSLRISGMVLEARTLEPAQGMLVGVYSNLSDTAISTLPMERVSRTNQLGQFTIRNLKAVPYRIFALNDVNRDYKWDRTEDVAFYDTTIVPYAEPIIVTDTLRSSQGTDSLVERAGTAFMPNDILLTWFNEGYLSQYLKEYARPERRRITIEMAAPADSLPELTIASGPMQGRPAREWSLLIPNPTLDSLQYWITDSTVLATDSLYLSVKYLRTDTADMLAWRTDTLKFFYKEPKIKEDKKSKSKRKAEAVRIDSLTGDTLPPPPPPPTFLTFKAETSSQQELNLPLIFSSSQPIDTLRPDGVHLQIKVDTIWQPVEGVSFVPDSMRPYTHRIMEVPWLEGEKYRLTVDSAAVVGIYNEWNNRMQHEFTVKNSDEYSNLTFNVAGCDSAGVIELLDKSEKVIAVAPVVDGVAEFPYLKPATIYARLYLDQNHNGVWDTGSLIDSLQPEEMYYFPKKIKLRKNWDITQDWDIYQTPVDLQKPLDIKKNKPKTQDNARRPEDEEDEDEELGVFPNFR